MGNGQCFMREHPSSPRGAKPHWKEMPQLSHPIVQTETASGIMCWSSWENQTNHLCWDKVDTTTPAEGDWAPICWLLPSSSLQPSSYCSGGGRNQRPPPCNGIASILPKCCRDTSHLLAHSISVFLMSSIPLLPINVIYNSVPGGMRRSNQYLLNMYSFRIFIITIPNNSKTL